MPPANRSSRTGSQTHPGRLLLIMALITAAIAAWALWPGQDNAVRLGLDLRGGTQVILQPKAVQEGATITDDQLAQTVQIIRQRVDGVGVAEAEVTVQGSGEGAAIVVSVPDVSQERLVELVGRTALLDFRPVWTILGPAPATLDDTSAPAPAPTGDDTATSARIVQAAENTPEFEAELAALDCLDPINQAGGTPDDPQLWLGTCDQDGAAKYSLQPAFIQGTNVTDAVAQLPQQGVGGWVVSLTFDSEGARALAQSSQELYALPDCSPGGPSPCNAFAIVLDGVVVSAPRFNEPIIGGQAQIEGDFTAQEAQDLANILSYGALPVTLDVVEVTSVSPTVGNDQLRAGLIAGAIGAILIVIFFLLYYRVLGIVAIASLVMAGGLTYLLFVALGKTVGFTLTLAGVAGAIVSIGITADSFIIYYERIRDALREGKSMRQAAEIGWMATRRTILAADFVTLLAAVVLYIVSVGNVRGFAFTLGLITVVDLIVAFIFTYPLTVLVCRSSWMQRTSWLTGLRRTDRSVDAKDTDAREADRPTAGVES
ncbi:MAG: protein translocase subunit SecD [Actinobacteria bacterium]|nr:protein translocase subunit SecD [Actinomycetota bacterium]